MENFEILCTDGITSDRDYIWYLNNDGYSCFLIKISKSTGELFVAVNLNDSNNYAYRNLINYKEYIFLVPYNSDKLCVYHKVTGKLSYIDIWNDSNGQWRFWSGCIVNNYLILFGNTPMLVYINLDDFFTVCQNISEYVKDFYIDGRDLFNKGFKVVGNNVYLFSYYYNKIVCVDVIKRSVEIIEIPEKDSECIFDSTIIKDDTICYINRNNYDAELRIIDLSTNEIANIKLPYKNEKIYRMFVAAIEVDGEIWFIPGRAVNCIKLDTERNQLEILDAVPVVEKNMFNDSNFLYAQNYRDAIMDDNGQIISIFPWEQKIIFIDTKSGNVRKKDIVIPDNCMSKEYFKNSSNCIFSEKFGGNLNTFLSYISEM